MQLKFSVRKALRLLPAFIRRSLFRRFIQLPLVTDPKIRLKVAETAEELEAAFRILHDAYVEKGYMDPQPSGMRLSVFHALPSTSTLIVLWEKEVVGTVSIIRSNPIGLPLEKIFCVDDLRTQGQRVAEISALAIKKEFRRKGGELLFPLLKFLYEYCIGYFGVDHLVIAVNPKDVDLYQGLLFFKKIKEQVVPNYDYVKGAPAVGLHLNLRKAYKEFAQSYGNKPSSRNLFTFFTKLKIENILFPKRQFPKISDPVMTPELLNYFFREKTQIFDVLSEEERRVLSKIYTYQTYKKIVPPSEHADRDNRFETKLHGNITLSQAHALQVVVLNVSQKGICCQLGRNIRFGATYELEIKFDGKIAEKLTIRPRWTDYAGMFGFEIERSEKTWNAFIQFLDVDLERRTPELAGTLKLVG